MKAANWILISLLIFISRDLKADSTRQTTIHAYAEGFYLYNFNSDPFTASKYDLLYNFNRNEQFSLNIAMIGISTQANRSRLSFKLHAGTYPMDNYAHEPEMFQFIHEAYAGIKLGKAWLDLGVFPSHLGFESPIGIDQPTISRSLSAENSPYYLSGARLYRDEGNWTFGFTVCNGWQRIQRQMGNSLPGLGTQLTYKQDKFSLNWSTYVGSELPDEIRAVRYFNNFYGIIELDHKSTAYLGFDLGLQQRTKGSTDLDYWYALTGIVQHSFNAKHGIAFRYEYYEDIDGIIVPGYRRSDFNRHGISVNYDFKPAPDVALRIEVRNFQRWKPRERFFNRREPMLMASIAVKFEELLN